MTDAGADLATALFDLGRLVVRLSPRDMSLTAASTLAALRDGGSARISALAEREGVAQPSMTELVNRLERSGLVVRRPDPADRRAVIVELTPEGAALLDRRRRERAGRLAGLVAALEPPDQASLQEALPALRRLLEGGLAERPPGT